MPELEARKCQECGSDFEGSEWDRSSVCDGCDRPGPAFRLNAELMAAHLRDTQRQLLINQQNDWAAQYYQPYTYVPAVGATTVGQQINYTVRMGNDGRVELVTQQG